VDIEDRIEAIEAKLKKTQTVAGAAFGLAVVVAVFAFIQLMSN